MPEAVDETVEETVEEEVPATVEEIEEEEKEFKNPQARARFLEKENRVLESRLNQMGTALQQLMSQSRVQEEVEQPESLDVSEEEWSVDPLKVLHKEVREIRREIEENKQRQAANSQMGGVQQAINSANAMLAARLNENRPIMESAFIHLFSVIDGEVEDEMPHLTQKERFAEVSNRLNLMKLAAVQAGRDPSDDFIRKSKRFGWKAPAITDEDGDEGRAEIRAANKKNAGSRTVSTVDGGTPKTKLDFSKMDKATFNKTIDDGLKSGKFKREGGAYRTPPMRDLLPAKVLIRQG